MNTVLDSIILHEMEEKLMAEIEAEKGFSLRKFFKLCELKAMYC